MNLKKYIAGVLSFASLTALRKPAAVAVQATQTKASRPAPAVNAPVPNAKRAPVASMVGAEDDDEAEMRGAGAIAQARERERARCAAIFESAGAARNPVLAASLAFGTSMTRREAIRTLDAMPEPATSAPTSRTSRNPNLKTGSYSHVPTSQAQAGWAHALRQANTR